MDQESAPTIIAGRYQLGKRLAKGGMGTVFYGHDQQTGDAVAIKRLEWDQIADEPHLLQRFVREGELLASLAHPNIVRLLTACQAAEHYYLVMELVEGGTLRDLMANSPSLPIDRILDFALQIADALAFAHQHQIVHRDLKPANVLLTADGQARLTDFGCALLLTASHALTSTGLVIGTLNYLSPEACRGLRQDARADLWSFGVMLYQMLTKALPFEGDNMVAVINAILSLPTPDPLAKRPDTPKPLADLIRRLLVKDRDQRLTSAAQMIAILKSIQQGDVQPPDLSAYTVIVKPQSRLPAQSTSFIGRDYEIEEFANLLTANDCRLLTLIGPGGIGKTRLSIEIARSVLSTFPNGVYFVSLAPLDSPHLIPSAIAEALQFTFYGGTEGEKPPDPVTQLVNYLEHKTALLVLDNFEHLIGGTDMVGQLLAGAPGLKIMVTSREVLNLDGEWRRPVEGLIFPENAIKAQANPKPYSALALFAERARLIKSDFRLEENLEAVVTICQLVEGMPLAIELAAGWLWMMRMDEIAAEITTGIDFLDSNRRETTRRHKSLRAVFESSWRLAEIEHQRALAQLSVFRGGFLRDAAAALGIRLPVLSRLADKSLVAPPKNGRYGLHELLRQYAEEKLREDEALYQDARTLHSRHYLEWVAHLEPNLWSNNQLEMFKVMRLEMDNIRTAWEWAVETQAWSDLRAGATAIWRYGLTLSRGDEVRELFDGAIHAVESVRLTMETRTLCSMLLGHRASLERDFESDPLFVKSLAEKAFALVKDLEFTPDVVLAMTASIEAYWPLILDYPEPEQLLEQCRQFLRKGGAVLQETVIVFAMGLRLRVLGDAVEGLRLAEEGIALLARHGDLVHRALAHHAIAFWTTLGNAKKLEHLQASLALWREVGNQLQIGKCLNDIGYLHIFDNPQVAEMYFLQAYEIGRELGSASLIIFGLDSLADARLARGDNAAARGLHLERLALCDKHQINADSAYSLLQLGKLAQAEGDLRNAESYYLQSRTRFDEAGLIEQRILVQCTLILMWLGQKPMQLEHADAQWHPMSRALHVMWVADSKVVLILTQAHRLAAHGQFETAIEFCSLVINSPLNQLRWPTSLSPTAKEHADLLLQRIQADLSPDVVEAALQRGSALDLDEVFQSLAT